MIKFALLGAGRIGKMHANNIVLNSQSDLEVVYDVNNSAAREVSNMHNCKIAQSAEEAITNKNIEISDYNLKNTKVNLQKNDNPPLNNISRKINNHNIFNFTNNIKSARSTL